jgi:hypothetical protein
MSMHELFAEAVERLKAGEPAASIVASYPVGVQAELGKLLAIVEMADQVAVQPLPQRSVRQRSLARAQFLQQAGAIRAEMEETLGAPALQPGGARTSANTPTAPPSWWERLRVGWGNIFDRPLLRLAPLAAVAVAVYVATFWTVRTAEAALPGDVVYPLKQWVREQKVSLAPPEQRIEVITAVQEEIKREAETLAMVLKTRPEARAELAIEYSEAMIYYGRRGNLLLIGPFLVAPNYQPNAAVEKFVPMVLDPSVQPGATVQLTYRVLPGNPHVVQGVSATVVDAPKPAPEPTATATAGRVCQVTLSPNWTPYPVRQNDTLEDLALRSNASVASIMEVNCLPDRNLADVSSLLLPDTLYVRVTPANMPTPIPTLPPTVTPLPTATIIPQPTATPRPPAVVPTDAPAELPTGMPTEESTVQPAATPTGEPEQTPIMTPAETAQQTPSATPFETPFETPPVLPTQSPSAPSTVSPTGSPTESPTEAPTESATEAPTPSATGEPNVTIAPTEPATVAPVSTPVEATTVAATLPAEAPTNPPTSAPTAASVQEPTAVPTTVPTTVPTQAPPTQALIAPVVPTAVPPTPIPPTPVPSTPVPPAAPASEVATPEPG